MKYLFSLFTFALLLNCSTQKTTKYSQIQYEAGACFGACPIFKMTINPDRTAVFEAEHFNFSQNVSKAEFSKPREGTFKGTIKKEDYDQLIQLLDASDLKTLKDKYTNKNITDLPTSHLKITFSDGTVKQIEDYGKNGTPKLKEIYKFIENLRQPRTWMKVD